MLDYHYIFVDAMIVFNIMVGHMFEKDVFSLI